MTQIKRYGFSAIFFATGLLLASSAWAEHTPEHTADARVHTHTDAEAVIGGKVGNVDTEDQSFQLKATPKTSIKPGSAEVNVTSSTDFVGIDGLADLEAGDKVQVESGKTVSGEVTAETVTKV